MRFRADVHTPFRDVTRAEGAATETPAQPPLSTCDHAHIVPHIRCCAAMHMPTCRRTPPVTELASRCGRPSRPTRSGNHPNSAPRTLDATRRRRAASLHKAFDGSTTCAKGGLPVVRAPFSGRSLSEDAFRPIGLRTGTSVHVDRLVTAAPNGAGGYQRGHGQSNPSAEPTPAPSPGRIPAIAQPDAPQTTGTWTYDAGTADINSTRPTPTDGSGSERVRQHGSELQLERLACYENDL